MTLILRSDARALNHIGGSHGFSGPLDYVAMLDFSAGEYFVMTGGRRMDIPLNEAVSVSRISPGVVKRRDGSLASVQSNTPRISYIPEYQMSGLLVESARTNFATSGANGSTVTIPSAGDPVLLSYSGGDASLTSAALTFSHEYEANGRSVKYYTRSAGVIAATLAVSGGAHDIQVTQGQFGAWPGHFLGYGGSQAVETAALGSAFSSLIAAGEFTIVQQVCMNPTGALDVRDIHMMAVKSGAPQGGLYLRGAMDKSSLSTSSVRTSIDGSGSNQANPPRAHIGASWRDVNVMGLTCRNQGDDVGFMIGGQYATASGLGPQFGTPANIYLGGEVGSFTLPSRIGGIITRCVIYDRMLTDDEAWAVANAWR